jgi:hypothetical protein
MNKPPLPEPPPRRRRVNTARPWRTSARPSPVTTALAERVMRARAYSVCSLCPDVIYPGQQIGKLPGRGWSHTRCVIDASRESAQ